MPSRTNLAQWTIAQEALDHQLLMVNWGLTAKQIFTACLHDMWADNGDTLSFMYTGTGALRTEHIRKGNVSITGKLSDLMKNVNRFVVNNFQDDAKQAVIEIILGKFSKDQQKQVVIVNPHLLNLDSEITQAYTPLPPPPSSLQEK